jgi:predicted amidohydrolase YtcJ
MAGLAQMAVRVGQTKEPRPSFDTALALYTQEPAFAAFEEQRRGRLEVGMDADLTVLAEDPRSAFPTQPERVAAIGALATYVAGVAVH